MLQIYRPPENPGELIDFMAVSVALTPDADSKTGPIIEEKWHEQAKAKHHAYF